MNPARARCIALGPTFRLLIFFVLGDTLGERIDAADGVSGPRNWSGGGGSGASVGRGFSLTGFAGAVPLRGEAGNDNDDGWGCSVFGLAVGGLLES